MRFKVNAEAKSLFIDFGRDARCYPGFAHKLLSLVTENQAVAINALVELSRSLEQGVLHLEEIGEVRVGFDHDIQIDGLRFMIRNLEVFVKSSAHRALSNNRHWRIHINGPRSGNEEELR